MTGNPEDKAKIRRNVAKMAAAGASTEEIEAYLQHATQQVQPLVASPRSELADTTAGAAIEEDTEPSYGGRFVRTVLNAASGIPGVEAAMAGAGALGSKLTDNPLSYRESLETLREETGRIPTGRRIAGKALGSVAVLPFLPANPAAAGAAFGAADQLLDADPNEGLGERSLEAALAGAAGAVAGKGASVAMAGGRALLAQPTAKVLDKLVSQKAKVAGPLYRTALREGQGRTASSSAIQNALQKPDIKEIVAELKKTRQFANVADDAPEMLDAVYKVLSDRAGLAKRAAEAVSPNRPNIGRYRREDIKAAQEELMDAMAGGSTVPGPMPTMRKAVETFAKESRKEEAVKRGHDVVRSAQNKNVLAAKSLKNIGPEAFEKYLKTAPPELLDLIEAGQLGAAKEAMRKSPVYMPLERRGRMAVKELEGLLRKTGTKKQRRLEDILKASIAGTATQF